MPGGRIPETCVRDLEVAQDLAEREDRIRRVVGSDLENREQIVKRVSDFLGEADKLFTKTEYTVEKGIVQGCSLGNFVAELSLQTSLINNRGIIVDCILSLEDFKSLNFLKNSLTNAYSLARQKVSTANAVKNEQLVYNIETASQTVVNIFKHFGLSLEKEL